MGCRGKERGVKDRGTEGGKGAEGDSDSGRKR